MSSLPEKSKQPTATAATTTSSIVATKPAAASFFFRSDSIRKIKCTAVYPFQVAGIKLSKNFIIELLETNINKARICTQKTMLNFYYVILKLLSTLFTLWDNKVPVKASVQTTVVDSDTSSAIKTNNSKTLTADKPFIATYQTRLEEKLNKIQKHKSRLNGDRLIPSVASETTTQTAKPAPTPSSSATDLTCFKASLITSSENNSKLFKLRSNSLLNKSKFQEYCLALCVHAGLVVMYLQIVILGVALNTTYVPAGLIFLLVTIAIIGYIFVKVSLPGTQSANSKSPKSSPLPKAKGSRNSRDLVKDDFSPERQSRSKAKRVPLAIELKYTTLSKIKLL